jgi:predicted HicB family RNase H-like nuclease
VALRLPRTLHQAAALRASEEDTSLNTLITTAVASWLGGFNARATDEKR